MNIKRLKLHSTGIMIHDPNNPFDPRNATLDMCMWNKDYPLAEKTVGGINFRVAEGFIRNRKKSYLVYRNMKDVGMFMSLDDAKKAIDNGEFK